MAGRGDIRYSRKKTRSQRRKEKQRPTADFFLSWDLWDFFSICSEAAENPLFQLPSNLGIKINYFDMLEGRWKRKRIRIMLTADRRE